MLGLVANAYNRRGKENQEFKVSLSHTVSFSQVGKAGRAQAPVPKRASPLCPSRSNCSPCPIPTEHTVLI